MESLRRVELRRGGVPETSHMAAHFVISVVVGGGFMLVMRDEASVWVFAGLMGFMVVLWLLAVGLPWLMRRRDLRGRARCTSAIDACT